MMMMDVLSHLPEVQICTAYELDGQRTTRFPSHVDDLRRVKPVYETLPGWNVDVTGIRELSAMPANAALTLARVPRNVMLASAVPSPSPLPFASEKLKLRPDVPLSVSVPSSNSRPLSA